MKVIVKGKVFHVDGHTVCYEEERLEMPGSGVSYFLDFGFVMGWFSLEDIRDAKIDNTGDEDGEL